jgi:hypothetical protein
VNVSSSVHLQVSGEALRPPRAGTSTSTDDDKSNNNNSSDGSQDGAPAAARSDIFTTRHWMDSYGNSKLAQLLHMSALQARLDGDKPRDTGSELKVNTSCIINCDELMACRDVM